MFKTPIIAAAVLGTVLSAGAVMNTGIAKADPPACGQGQPCLPGGNHEHHKFPGGGGGNWPQGGKPPGQMGSNQDWKHQKHHGDHWDNGGVGVGIYLGGDGYYGDGYNGDGYYDNAPPPRFYGNYVSCGEAKSIVRSRGYYNVRTESCDPGDYTFLGSKRGERFEIEVSGRGRIVSVDSAD